MIWDFDFLLLIPTAAVAVVVCIVEVKFGLVVRLFGLLLGGLRRMPPWSMVGVESIENEEI